MSGSTINEAQLRQYTGSNAGDLRRVEVALGVYLAAYASLEKQTMSV